MHILTAKAASVLQSRLLGDKNQWTCAVMTWSRLQGELAYRRTPANAPRTVVEVTMNREEGRRSEKEEKCDEESRKSAGGEREESANGRQRSGEQNGAQMLEKKRKRDDREEEEGEEERKGTARKSSSEKKVEKEKTSEKERTPGLSVESSSRTVDGTVKDFAVNSVKNEKTTGRGDETQLQPSGIKAEPCSDPVSFRISCKCTGSLSRYFSSQEVSKVIGVGLSRQLGWKTDLRNPQLEVNIYLSDDHCLMGIPLTRLPLANRSYIKTTGLRSTVAWAMTSLAQIQPGFCVVDPMCGVGTILIEAAQEHKTARFLGVDIDDGQLQKANENVEFAKLGNRIHLLKASSMALPLPSASVDAVVCDLPFGRKFGTKTNMAANLPLIVTEMERVLCTGGTLVLLLSPQLSCQLKKLLPQQDTTSNQETTTQTGTHNCPTPSLSRTRQQTFQIDQAINSKPTQKTGCQSGLQHSLPPPLSCLKHQTTLRVSLGLIDGLIHKYVKTDT
ncbi:uncharacterized protein thumpd2 isoform 2-T2 [Acanthopagrus schlegelii]